MIDEELYNLVRENYLKCNKEYLEQQLRICQEEIAKIEAKNKNEKKGNKYDYIKIS